MLDKETVLNVNRFGAIDIEGGFLTNHHLGELVFIGLTGFDGGDVLAFAEDGDSVGDLHDLVKLVGDDNDGLSVFSHVLENSEKVFDLKRGENGGWLIKDEDLSVSIKDLDDLKGLLLRNGKLIDLFGEVKFEAVLVADFLNGESGVFHIGLFFILDTENDVLKARENVDEFEVLMDHADLEGEGIHRGRDRYVFAVDVDVSLVWEIDARKHVHESGLATAILSQEGKDLAFIYVEGDVFVGDDGSEGFRDVLESYANLFFNGLFHVTIMP